MRRPYWFSGSLPSSAPTPWCCEGTSLVPCGWPGAVPPGSWPPRWSRWRFRLGSFRGSTARPAFARGATVYGARCWCCTDDGTRGGAMPGAAGLAGRTGRASARVTARIAGRRDGPHPQDGSRWRPASTPTRGSDQPPAALRAALRILPPATCRLKPALARLRPRTRAMSTPCRLAVATRRRAWVPRPSGTLPSDWVSPASRWPCGHEGTPVARPWRAAARSAARWGGERSDTAEQTSSGHPEAVSALLPDFISVAVRELGTPRATGSPSDAAAPRPGRRC